MAAHRSAGERASDGVPAFHLSRSRIGPVAILSVTGELDMASSPQLGATLNDMLRTLPAGVVIDLAEVTFVDSSGLAVLLNALRRSTRQGVELKLACDVPSTLELLSLTRLDGDFDVHPTQEEAVKAITAATRVDASALSGQRSD